MKKSKTVICLLFLAAAAAGSIYAVSIYNRDMFFYPHTDTVIFLSVFAVCAVMMTAMKNSLLPLLISTAAGIITSIFFPCCSFLVIAPVLTICQLRNITATDKIPAFCRKASFVLTAAACVPFIPAAIKAANLNSDIHNGRSSVFGYVVRIFVFLTAVFFFFLFSKSFSVIRIRSAKTVKKKNNKETSVYPESLHTVYLLAAIGALISAVYCCITDDNALVCVSIIAWAGTTAAFHISGDPMTAYLHTKVCAFSGISADNTQT